MEKAGSANRKQRKEYLDLIRIIAIVLVLFNHTGNRGFVFFTQARESLLYPFYLCGSVLIKTAVPLFFMVSGALLLGKKEGYRAVLKRFFRFSAILLIASFIAYLYKCFRLHTVDFSLISFFETVYKEPVSVQFWYMYVYLVYILMLPFLRCLARNMDRKAFQWLFIMYAFINSLTVIDFVLWQGRITHYSGFSMFIANNNLFFPLMGYYLDNLLKKEEYNRKALYKLLALSLISVAVCCAVTHMKCALLDDWSEKTAQSLFNNVVYMPACTAFYGIKALFIKRNIGERLKKVITTLGGATFGLYLIEQICRHETEPVFTALEPVIHTVPACMIWILTACAMGIVITLLIKKIPRVGKYL